MSRTVEYRFKMVDNITPAAQTAETAVKKVDTAVKETNASVDSQALLLIKNITVLTAFREGLNGMIQELNYLGIVTGKTYESIRKMASVMNLFVDAARMIRGVVGIMEVLQLKTTMLAAVETFRSVLNSKGASLALVGVAGVAAGGVGGFFAGRAVGRRETTINQTNYFNSATPASGGREQQRQALESWEGY
jgi:CDP-diglyceride synthetase